jgi:signal transduction histidine kinase
MELFLGLLFVAGPIFLIYSLISFVRQRRLRADLKQREQRLEVAEKTIESLRVEATGLRQDVTLKVMEADHLGVQLSNLTAELAQAHVTIAAQKKQIDESLSKGELAYLHQALDDSGARNSALRAQAEELSKILQQAQNDLDYVRHFGKRFRHDTQTRIELVRSLLLEARSGLSDHSFQLANQQLNFILESLVLNLAPDIGAYVAETVESRKDHFNLGKRLEHLIDTYKNQAQEYQIAVRTDDSAEILLWGNWLHVELLVTNLVSNALKHGRCDSPIEIELRKEGQNAVLTVENEGPQMPAEYLAIENDQAKPCNKGFGLYFVRQVTQGYSGTCQWKNIKQVKGSGLNKKSDYRVQAVVTLPVMH